MNFMIGSVQVRWRFTASSLGNMRARQALADDHDPLGVAPIGVAEIAPGDDRHAERGEEPGRHGSKLRARIVLAIRLWRSPRRVNWNPGPNVPPSRHGTSAPTATRSTPGQLADSAHRFFIEAEHLIRRSRRTTSPAH